MLRFIIIISLVALLNACAPKSLQYSPATLSQLTQGKRDFMTGYYKRAKKRLYPLACNGHPVAQYAIGYLYYYGYGVAQDIEVGAYWINRAAEQNYPPAIQALQIIKQNQQPDEACSEPKLLTKAHQKKLQTTQEVDEGLLTLDHPLKR